MYWTASEQNVQHAKDANGILVHTPDADMPDGISSRPGWWKVDEENMGMPYKWGGFDTPRSFEKKLKQGYAAGDVYTRAKRAQLESGVSQYAAGIDCSGLISRCWRLDRPYSTRELANLCEKLPSYADLQPGDILNKNNDHALLFVSYVEGTSGSHFWAYETGAPPTWKVLLHTIPVNYVKSRGYSPYRYHGMKP